MGLLLRHLPHGAGGWFLPQGGSVTAALKRPLVRYHGGKWLLAPWIIRHLPGCRVYVEPFGGGGSVLLRRPRCYAEVYNDLDSSMVNLFRIVRDRGPELVRALELTPFAREEYRATWKADRSDTLEWARHTVIRSFMGFGSNALQDKVLSGFRQTSNRSGTTPAHDWRNYPATLVAVIERLRGVVIEHRDALEVIAAQDAPETLFYCDPPYLTETRSTRMHGHHGYNHEMTDEDHMSLAARLATIEGMAVVSGYHHPLYDTAYAGWERFERSALADGAKERTEVLWVNPRAAGRITRNGHLLDGVELTRRDGS